MDQKKMPIGIDDFAEIIKQNLYYVDKTGMIKEILEHWCMVHVLTRPRYFGKSVNISMLRHFFEIGTDKSLFDGLAISTERELCEKYMGKYPVIFLSFRSVSGSNFEEAESCIREIIKNEANRFSYMLDSDGRCDWNKNILTDLIYGKGIVDFGIRDLSRVLKEYYGEDVIILIDDFDMPLRKAYENGYYGEMNNLLDNMFGCALKGNQAAEFGVLMGCMSLSKEGIVSGFNNYNTQPANWVYHEMQFGFTYSEVRELLEDYSLEAFYETTIEWYGGYKMGRQDVCCPRDVINWCSQLINTTDHTPQNYWIDSDGMDIAREFMENADRSTQYDLHYMIEGETCTEKLFSEYSYRCMLNRSGTMLNFLYAFGYLTCKRQFHNGIEESHELCIPNKEIGDTLVKCQKGIETLAEWKCCNK